MKRTVKEVSISIIRSLSDSKEHTYGFLERKVNTNWESIRNHCELLWLFDIITISKDNKVRLTKRGQEILKKL